MSLRRFSMKFGIALLAVGALAAQAQPVNAACTINVFVENIGEHRIWVRNEFAAGKGTAVRVTAGGWAGAQRRQLEANRRSRQAGRSIFWLEEGAAGRRWLRHSACLQCQAAVPG